MMELLLSNIFTVEFERSKPTCPTSRLNNCRKYIDTTICFIKVVRIRYVEIEKLQ